MISLNPIFLLKFPIPLMFVWVSLWVPLCCAADTDMVFPGEKWAQSAPGDQGVDSRKLAHAIDYLKRNSGPDGVRELVVTDSVYSNFLEKIGQSIRRDKPTTPGSARPRLRDLGVNIGTLEPGPLNAVTDVEGVLVGHRTLVKGDSVRTGVTAILPHGGNLLRVWRDVENWKRGQ